MSEYLDYSGLDLYDTNIKNWVDAHAASTGDTPIMDGTAAIGVGTRWARNDHVHPSDTSKANLDSPTFTGTPKAPTATAGTNNTQIATTAFVATAISGITPTNAFGNVKVGSTTIAADSGNDMLELVAGSNITLTPDATNDNVTIAATDTTYTGAQMVAAIGNTPVNRATADASGNNIASTYALKTEISGVYKYKGSVATASNLPASGQVTGDVYNIEAESTYGPAGTNVAWTGSAWDALGGLFSITSISSQQINALFS